MKDLTAIIKEKAEAKLKKDIDLFLKCLNQSPFWACVENEKMIIKHDGEDSLRILFWNGDNCWAYNTILEKTLPVYIERESKEFYDKVDRFQAEYQELFEEQQ